MEEREDLRTGKNKTFDDIIADLGELGRFQVMILIFLGMSWVLSMFFLNLPAFDLAIPKHRCKISSNDSYMIQDEAHRRWIQKYIPASSSDLQPYDKCHIMVPGSNSSGMILPDANVTLEKKKCSSWVYDKETFQSTFVSEKDLVCDDAFMRSSISTTFYGGVLVGSFVFGLLSDIIGRRMTSLISLLMMIIFSTAMAFIDNYYAFVCVRFLLGVSLPGMFMGIYVLMMEWTGPSKRRLVIIIAGVISGMGECFVVLLAYLIRQRPYLQISLTVPVAVFTVVVFFILPESPRWLLTRGRKEQAYALIQKAAKTNKKILPSDCLDNVQEDSKESGRLYLIFTYPRLACRTLIVFYCWLICNMVQYGLILNTQNLYGDFYVNMLIFAITGLVTSVFPYVLLDRFGRVKTLSSLLIIGGAACLSTIFTVNFGGKELQPLTTALAIFGRCSASAAYAAVYLFSAELFPTVVRNAGMGASSCSGRIGSMISPFIADSANLVAGKGGQAIPLIIFGSITVLGGFLSILLPETFKKPLPETMDDALHIGKLKKTSSSNQEEKVKEEKSSVDSSHL